MTCMLMCSSRFHSAVLLSNNNLLLTPRQLMALLAQTESSGSVLLISLKAQFQEQTPYQHLWITFSVQGRLYVNSLQVDTSRPSELMFMLLIYNLKSSNVLGVYFAPIEGSDNAEANGELSLGGPDSSRYTGNLNYFPLTKTSPYSEYVSFIQGLS